MDGVMKVIAPLSIEVVTTVFRVMQETRIVRITLGDQMNSPAQSLRQFCDRRLEFCQEVACAEIEDSVNRVQAQGVEVVVLQPVQSVFDEESPYLVAFFSVKVDGLTPRTAIAISKVRAVSTKVVAFRAEMVVNHVQGDREAVLMGGVYETLERFGSAVTVLGSEEIHPVVTPVSRTGKLRDRHHFDGSNSEGSEFVKVRDYGVERSFGRVGPDMKFIEDAALQISSRPAVIRPAESTGVHDRGGTMLSLRLEPRRGIG